MRFFATTAALLGALTMAGCSSGERAYTAAATVPCLRAEGETLLRPSRAAAREARHPPRRPGIMGVGRSGSTIGTKSSGGDYQVVLYPSEEILYFHFARSGREASRLLEGYRA